MESGKQRLDCACAVGLGFRPLVFNLGASIGALCFFNCFLTSFGPSPGPRKAQNLRVGGRGGTQLIDFKNKALVYLYLDSLLPLRYGAFYMQPGGSSLDPRPDLRRLRRAPGRGRFVYVFVVFVALCRALWCLFGTLGGLAAPLWHLGLPF